MPNNEGSSSKIILSFEYGSEDELDRDVDLFSQFYTERYGEKAASQLLEQALSSYKRLAIAGLPVAVCFCIPVLIAPSSIWSWIMLILIFGPLVFSIHYFRRYQKAKQDPDAFAAQLLNEEYDNARQKWKRIFPLSMYEDRMVAEYTVSKAKRHVVRYYDEIKAIYETDELFFIQGLTWFSKFLLSEEQIGGLRSILKSKCADVYHDETTASVRELTD